MAMVYDLLPVVAIGIVVTVAFLPFLHGRRFIPAEVGALAYLHRALVLAAAAGFFVYFWTTRGQTIGMMAWRLRVQKRDGSLIDWKQATARVLVVMTLWVPFFVGNALFWGHWTDRTARGLAIGASLLPVVFAYAWIWIDRDRLAWHDHWTDTRVTVLPKRKK